MWNQIPATGRQISDEDKEKIPTIRAVSTVRPMTLRNDGLPVQVEDR